MKNDKYVDMFGAMYSKYFVRDVDSCVALYKMRNRSRHVFFASFIATLAVYNRYEAFDFTFLETDNSCFRDTAKFECDVSIFICASFKEFVVYRLNFINDVLMNRNDINASINRNDKHNCFR